MESTQPLREQEQAALKDKRRQEILNVGMQLCLARGIVNMDMKEVAAQAQVSRATLYRYYPSKKALVYAILRYQAAEVVSPQYHAQRLAFEGNGYSKFSQFVSQLVEAYYQFPDFYRFMGMVNFYYSSQQDDEDLVELYREIFEQLLVRDTPQIYLEEGQRDGSVRQEIDPGLYTSMVIESVVCLAEQLAMNPEMARQTYMLEKPGLLLDTMASALLHAIRVDGNP